MNMKDRFNITRRGLIYALAASAVGTPATAAQPVVAASGRANTADHKARYQADSVEVQTFYRVNRYPKK
jgi:hypothetical protein